MRHAKAFTLIELTIVIVIVAILAVIAMIAWPGQGINASAQAERLASDIRYVQNLAMTKHQRYRINFSSSQYTLTDNASNGVIHPTTGSSVVSLPSGMSLSTSGLSNGYIEFESNGRPYSAPTTALSSAATITISTSTTADTVSVAAQTGKVSAP
jgi:prepilin-type N-terminal cleavage/methylation domain-containing protein